MVKFIKVFMFIFAIFYFLQYSVVAMNQTPKMCLWITIQDNGAFTGNSKKIRKDIGELIESISKDDLVPYMRSVEHNASSYYKQRGYRLDINKVIDNKGVKKIKLQIQKDKLTFLSVYVDKSIVELYINNRIYASREDINTNIKNNYKKSAAIYRNNHGTKNTTRFIVASSEKIVVLSKESGERVAELCGNNLYEVVCNCLTYSLVHHVVVELSLYINNLC